MAPLTIKVEHTWNGVPIPPDEHAWISFHATDGRFIIAVDAPFHNDPCPPAPPGVLWKLWEWEVVELFVAHTGDTYTEIELGPHGHFLGVLLKGERNIVSWEHEIDYQVTLDAGRWHGHACLPSTLLPRPPWRVNAYAIHGTGTRRRYLAAEPVPGPVPDYHRLQYFRTV